MTSSPISCACELLKEYFGEIVENVAKFLMTKGNHPLLLIAKGTKLPLAKVRKALCVLIQHNMVSFQLHPKRKFVEYSVDLDFVLLLMRYPRIICCAKSLFGEAAELLMEELLLNGQMTMSDAVENVTFRLNESLNEIQKIKHTFVLEKFEMLVKTNFFQRCPSVINLTNETEKSDIPCFSQDAINKYTIPEIKIHLLGSKRKRTEETEAEDQIPAKKARLDEEATQKLDDTVYWKVNFDRIHECLRDRLFVTAIENTIDKQAAAVANCIVRLAESLSDGWAVCTNPVSRTSIEKEMKLSGESCEFLSSYLSVLSEDSNRFISRVADSQEGLYVINRKTAITNLTWNVVETIIQERFGSKCLRIFRLVRLKQYLEQEQIEQMVMVPSKDAKEMTYRLMFENFLQVEEFSRTSDFAPSRTIHLLNIDLNQIAQMLLEWSFKALVNVIRRRQTELEENKRLLEKQQRVEVILATLKLQIADEAELEEVQNMITPMENAQLEKIKNSTTKLELSQLQIEETIHIFQLYLRYIKEKA